MRHHSSRELALVAAALLLVVALGAAGYYLLNVVGDARTAARHSETLAAESRDFAQAAVNETLANRAIGWERGAIDCLGLAVDNDRTFDLPDYCTRPEVLAFYPLEVCHVLGDPQGCGTAPTPTTIDTG